MAVAMDATRAAVDAVGDVVVDVLAELRGALDRLHALDPTALCDGDAVLGLWREAARVEALVSRQAAAFARGDEWSSVGARSAAAWLRVEARCDAAHARSLVRRGRALTRSPHVDEAFAAGVIGVDHVDRLVRANTRYTAGAFARDEAMLVAWAATMQYAEFVVALELWHQRADDEGAERRAERQHRRRRFHLSQSFEDTWYLNGVLDPISGQVIHGVVSSIERELFAADWADAKARLGRNPSVDELARTAPQRRADALVELATRAATAPKSGQRPAPLFTILVDLDSFARTCQLASGTVITPGSAARWLDRAVIERIVFDGPDRVLAVGHQRRFTGALRRAIHVRDRTCRHPYCDEPADRCDVDHIIPWALGGPTTLANGRLTCGAHNRQREPEHIRRGRRAKRSKRPEQPDRSPADE